jgi:hypothetical protein
LRGIGKTERPVPFKGLMDRDQLDNCTRN